MLLRPSRDREKGTGSIRPEDTYGWNRDQHSGQDFSDFLRDRQALALEELNDAGQIVSIMISIPSYATFLIAESTYKTKKNMGGFPCETTHAIM